MSLTPKIILPFFLLFVVVLAATVVVSVNLVVEGVEERIHEQCSSMTRVLREFGFLTTPESLRRIKTILDADIVCSLGTEGPVLSTTLPDEQAARLLGLAREWQATPLEEEKPAPGPQWQSAQLNGKPFRVLTYTFSIQPSEGRPDPRLTERLGHDHAADPSSEPGSPVLRLCYLFEPESILTRQREAAIPLLAIALAGLVCVLLVGILLAHRLSAPVRRLAETTRSIAAGQLELEVPVETRDEIGQLAESFNRMVEGLKQYQESLRRSERLATLGTLAAGLAHELRNPLTSLKMSLQLSRRKSTEPAPDQLDRMLVEVERLENLAAQLLDLGQPATLQRTPCKPQLLVRETLKLLEPQLRHQQIDVKEQLQELPDVPLDPVRFRQVLTNLILNALQAMKTTGTLRIRLTDRSEQLPPCWRLELTDTGQGLPDELREKVFDPFVTTKAGGAGLGLWVARRIVEEHGGRIGLEDSAAGTTVWLELPHQTAREA